MNFFNYFFYRICGLLINTKLDEEHPEITARGFISLFQFFNAVSLVYLFTKIVISIQIVLFISLPIYFFNLFFFLTRTKLKGFSEKWALESKSIKRKKGLFIILYIILSLVIFIAVIIEMRYQYFNELNFLAI
jgi:hypothetical protein